MVCQTMPHQPCDNSNMKGVTYQCTTCHFVSLQVPAPSRGRPAIKCGLRLISHQDFTYRGWRGHKFTFPIPHHVFFLELVWWIHELEMLVTLNVLLGALAQASRHVRWFVTRTGSHKGREYNVSCNISTFRYPTRQWYFAFWVKCNFEPACLFDDGVILSWDQLKISSVEAFAATM